MKQYVGLVLASAVLAIGVGCGSSGNGGGGGGGTGGGTGGNGGSGGQTDLCAQAGGGTLVTLPEEIVGDTLLSSDCTYRITRLTYVVSGTTTIEAGTSVFGNPNPGAPSGLIVTQNGRIDARGTAQEPIVFTSGLPEGERSPGDWGGVALLGRARLSFGGTACDGEAGECTDVLEGLESSEDRGLFGGNDDTHNCGTMEYVRIEFAGFELTANNELNSLTLAGCGDQTSLSYIQTHRGEDDGIEFFGGTAELDHALVTGPGDDGIDWDQGYRGTITNYIVDHFSPRSGDPRGMETDNNGGDFDSPPRSAPEVTYGTVIGGEGTDIGIVMREGTWGVLNDLVVVDFESGGFNMIDTAWSQTGGWPDGITVENSCFFNNTPNFLVDTDDPNDANDAFFDEDVELVAAERNNLVEDPQLGDTSGSATGGTPDYSVGNANCSGAFAPSGTDWTADWTAYPVD